MAAEYGFVYVLRNECMPGIYKIGYTDRSPRQRCFELSSSTSVPTAFELLCVGEVEDAPAIEHSLHIEWSEWRVSSGREFFRLDADEVLQLISRLKDLADEFGGLFCEVNTRSIHNEIAERHRDAVERDFHNTWKAKINHFNQQHHDMYFPWEDLGGFSGFGDAASQA